MVRCNICGKEMLVDEGCIPRTITFADGTSLKALKYGEDGQCDDHEKSRCSDCGCKVGNYHHYGCDMEVCPKCGGQLLSCSCAHAGEEGIEFEGITEKFIHRASQKPNVSSPSKK